MRLPRVGGFRRTEDGGPRGTDRPPRTRPRCIPAPRPRASGDASCVPTSPVLIPSAHSGATHAIPCPRDGAASLHPGPSTWALGDVLSQSRGRLPPTRDPRDVADHEGEHDGPDGDQDRLGRHGVSRVSGSTTQLTSWTSPRSRRGCSCRSHDRTRADLSTGPAMSSWTTLLSRAPQCRWPSGTTAVRWPRGSRVEACPRASPRPCDRAGTSRWLPFAELVEDGRTSRYPGTRPRRPGPFDRRCAGGYGPEPM